MPVDLKHIRSVLFVPGGNARALEKARGLAADMVVIDIEDAVPAEARAKHDAREAAMAALRQGFGERLTAVRVNGFGSDWQRADIDALAGVEPDYVVLPKIEAASDLDSLTGRLSVALLPMIETPAAIFDARAIAAVETVAGLIIGTNDLSAEIGARPGPSREGLELSLQMVVLAAAAAGKPAFDGVCNLLDDSEALEAQCRQGAAYGFAGKTLIHPGQVDTANRFFGPTVEAIDEARALVEAARGGAERFRGRMIEDLHVAAARALIERVEACA